MKTRYFLIALVTMLLSGIGMQAQSASATKKILVVYFSHSGNTREVANQIKDLTGGDIFEILPVKAYPSDYQACVDQAKKEINAKYKPATKNKSKEYQLV
jgi:Flavodoxins